ncbi:MAG: bifunctional 4-hydroxy-2-oxoglutarate aldolase/2-dehydro-3-deoxy-phosphogluconate aldolase [Acidobacteriaceae bacterium]|nr:bifunctional 4-hydroxy-2-oxoglutarate aldolase/2-dehydro-3-deoxy-phosphogluconate aldolase [Acidobacteriaceae bacterium]
MAKKAEVLAHVRKTGLVPVLRAESVEQGYALAEAIAAGGCDVLEVTMTVPGAVALITRLVKERPDILIGAGTVLTAEQAKACVGEGAQFIVSPAFDAATVEFCAKSGIGVLPGALTPTEVLRAWNAGADVIKVFPASAMGGAPYLRSLKAPLPQIELIPTGGVSLTTAREFLDAGAYALGIGADLVSVKAIRAGQPEVITKQARKYMDIVRTFQAETASA